LKKFIHRKKEADNGRSIFFSKKPQQNSDTTEFDKATKVADNPHINDLIEIEKKEIKNIRELIKEKSERLEQRKQLFQQKQTLLESELDKKLSSLSSTEKFAIMGEFSAKMAHDIRNPLSMIKTQVDLLKLRYAKQEDVIMLTSLDRMDRAISGITNQLNSVLNFLKESPMKLENHSLLSILEESIMYIQKSDNVTIELPVNDITMKCDSNKMQRVFVNMIQNSLQAIGSNEGSITVKTSQENNRITIEITDTGPGIPDEFLSKIFEPLFTTKKDGTGLGLPICKKIIEDHYGVISVKNHPTTFTIIIPKNQ
jgi:signal transduction histidine kinase